MSQAHDFAFAVCLAPHPAAAEAAREILIEGGNALEAATAAAATLGVVAPAIAGAGGDAVWLVREPRGRLRQLDASGRAAAALRRGDADGADAQPRRGPQAVVAAPGAVAGWRAALDLSKALGGRLPLDRILGPAIRAAAEGAPAPALPQPDDLAELAAAPGFAAAHLIDGALAKPGTRRAAPALASALEWLAHAGLDDFYRGDVGREIAAELSRLGAPVARQDLVRCEARWGDPPALALPGGRAVAPAGAAGGVETLTALALARRLQSGRAGAAAHLHGLVESARRAAMLTRAASATARLLDDEALLSRIAAEIGPRATFDDASPPSMNIAAGWIGVVDAQGLAVACTHSLGPQFGAGVVLSRVGVTMGGAAPSQALRPRDRLRSALSPVILEQSDGRVVLCAAAGGASEALATAGLVARLLDGQAPDAAVAAPRLCFASSPDGRAGLAFETGSDPALARDLARLGHTVVDDSAPSHLFGVGGAIARRPRDGRLTAASDTRADGIATGF